MPPSYADVVFPPRTSQAFTYRIPQSWSSRPQIGQWVLAPFGPRVKPGIIVSLAANAKQPLVEPGRLRELYRITSAHWEPDPKLVALAEWMTDYYLAPAGTCLALVQPPDVPFRSSMRWTITQQGQQRLETARTGTSTHILLTALAKRSKGLAQSTVETLLDNPSTVLQRLKRNTWIQAREDWTELPVQSSPKPATPPQDCCQTPEENHDLFSWWGRFRQHLAAKQFGELLLTDLEDPQPLLGDVIQETMAQDRTVLVIAPNINRATCLVSYLRYSVKHPIGEFHSGHSDKQRLQLWQAIKQGHYSVVVGTRSALFLPLPALGCVWIEREGDSAYKADPSPHHHAREVARKKAELDDAVLVLHAPYPTLETVHRFAGDVKSPRAFAGKSAPRPVQVLNLQDMAFGTMFSDALQNGMEQALKQGGGIVIYHNRKGFSSSITCRDCGTAPQCPRCRIPLGLRQSQLRCPYCGQAEPSPSACPACSGTRLEPVGFGTERLEEELRRLYPHAAIARYDGNTIRTEAAADRIREQFSQGKIHIVVGTELLFQASPFTPVRCVGIPYADAGLHVPDFRSSERVFHHLQQAVDLVPPGLSGSTIIQTRLPSHPVMHAIGQQEPDLFYDHELAFRRLVGYPPFGQLIQLHVSGQDATETEKTAKTWHRHLTEQLARMIAQGEMQQGEQDAVLGPLAAYGAQPRGLSRYHLLVKVADGTAGRTLVRRTLELMNQGPTNRRMKFGVNVDPIELL